MRAQCVYQAYKVSLTFFRSDFLTALHHSNIYIYIQDPNLEKLGTIGEISAHICVLLRPFFVNGKPPGAP